MAKTLREIYIYIYVYVLCAQFLEIFPGLPTGHGITSKHRYTPISISGIVGKLFYES